MNRSVNATCIQTDALANIFHECQLFPPQKHNVESFLPDKKPPANESSSAQCEPAIKIIAST